MTIFFLWASKSLCIAAHIDILEIGTPCIKRSDIKMVETLKQTLANNKILVGLNMMDAGAYEAEPFYRAGGDIHTVSGTAGVPIYHRRDYKALR